MSKLTVFDEFICENLDSAYRFAYTYMKNKEDAEDVVYDSVLKAMNSLHRLKNADSIKPWFFKIIANTALTALHRSRRTVLTDFTAEEHHALDTYEDDYTNLTTNEVLSCLGEDYRSIVILKACEDMTFGEIAAVLGISENTVKTRFYRAVKLLKTYMEEDGHE